MADSIKREGDKSPYIRVARGIFALRAPAAPLGAAPVKTAPLATDPADAGDVEDQYAVITSFGMFWRRDGVDWSGTPKLLGMQGIDATPVDLCGQFGVYLLYDGREVVYAGRATDRPLGKRLYEHTYDRLSSRWDRFSWFGLLPVSGDGTLGKMPDTFQAAKLIPAIEAILIESLEPRQNRRRGDGLETVEYMQRIDPAIEKKKLKSAFDAAMAKV